MRRQLAVIGMGYVGLPLAVGFAKVGKEVIGFDINKNKINKLKKGIDDTNEGGDIKDLQTVQYTYDPKDLRNVEVFVVAVPTPVNSQKQPDFSPLIAASEIVGRHLKRGAMVTYESTVNPGATEEICIPILEKESGLKVGKDFGVAYSPERINPGDREHRLESINKVVGANDAKTLKRAANLYKLVVTKANVVPVSSLKVAEAAKVIENAQRDINIAFMNELSILFHKLGIDTHEVLEAAGTKWNFLRFKPGLVGGHCIGVDPYYLSTKAKEVNYYFQLIDDARRVNEHMVEQVKNAVINGLVETGKIPSRSTVLVLGLTFKENVPDFRNSKMREVSDNLKKSVKRVIEHDPYMPENNKIPHSKVDAVLLGVAHKEYGEWGENMIKRMFKGRPVVVDVPRMWNSKKLGGWYWGL
ncbi:hypothetical protein A2899_01625 [Candidatus Amesbacteria bacterium RIFCSPLOWO2_01_FULL_49_25]|uniref:UDP-glucose/GDP-mannose dehydrogenase C-terminal domain-containing protein n=1 Tax=Candidatus Amesbacteria bacterium RIFCSPHIGHO2_01_FULL_48_32b TaxID=1797253 RepID=A0A1F4YD73_9BACT|nr:MAG: hypothetical protein A2876_03285 [Candidatus Amesbacteria bacterium RIFCSPHIGHO2_01_FULL_48_32b]OGD08475.1 MAG: hypothetical protein A2899_01625 [Candidatus Amesbacteria bacterium RIFCSPLOWO2_01_FULL_49_25]